MVTSHGIIIDANKIPNKRLLPLNCILEKPNAISEDENTVPITVTTVMKIVFLRKSENGTTVHACEKFSHTNSRGIHSGGKVNTAPGPFKEVDIIQKNGTKNTNEPNDNKIFTSIFLIISECFFFIIV